MNSQNTRNGKAGELWNRFRLRVCLCIALTFNFATATYTYSGMQALEGGHAFVTLAFCAALTVIKLIYEKEFCANLFSKRPGKAVLTSIGFAFFFAAAAFFNLLNIVNTQKAEAVRAAEETGKLDRWHNDTESVSKALARLRAAVAQAIGNNEAARRQARIDPTTPAATLEQLQQDRKLLAQVDASVKAISALPVTMPADQREASELLTKAVASIRNAAAMLPTQFASTVGDIQLARTTALDQNILSQLSALFDKGFATFSKPLFTAIILELFSVLALVAGYAGLTWADRIRGLKMVASETYRAVTKDPRQTTIPFAVAGSSTRGALMLCGKGPVSYPELIAAIEDSSEYLPSRVVALYNSAGEVLDPEIEVLSQLNGAELIVEVQD